MIRAVSEALVDVIHQNTPDLGDWVVLHSLNSADTGPDTSSNGPRASCAHPSRCACTTS